MTGIRFTPGQRVHCIGIGGAGMSGIARILKSRGLTVTGSDPVPSALTEHLHHEEGIAVGYVQDGSAVGPGIDCVVATAAAKADNPELAKARRLGIPVVKYAEALGALMRERVGIGVAGTHGKTTTASLLAHLFREARKQPSFLIGGEPHNLGTNAHGGRGPYFIAEACEYDRSFHRLAPAIAIVTNIDADHLDYFGSMEAIREAFAKFVAAVPPSGLVVVNGDDDATVETVQRAAICPVVVYGFDAGCDWRIERLGLADGVPLARLHRPSERPIDVALGVPGWQNVANATAAAVVADSVGIPEATIVHALRTFRGVGRRFDRLGHIRGVPVIDDYAHHPAEILATLDAARQAHPTRELWVAFQPHQAFRTEVLFDGFAQALAGADQVVLLDVYAARESTVDPRNRELSEELAAAVRRAGTPAHYLPSFDAATTFLRRELPADAVLMTMGAGNVHEVAEALVTTFSQAA